MDRRGAGGTSRLPAAAVAARSAATSGHGASGFTWSMVTGETPPQSSIPASTRRVNDAVPGERLGGACTLISAPKTRRVAATVQRRSSRLGSGAPAIFVPGFARKFWTMISWMWPWRSWISRIARSDSMRSRRVSPMPMRIPVVNGTRASPPRRRVASRTSGILSGEP